MSKGQPLVMVCAGGGGVGKTTTSAALALALARQGARTLVITIDPARRLADALGVRLGNDLQVIGLDPSTGDRLVALMPEPSLATRTFMDFLFLEEPDAHARLMANQLFLTLEDKLAGMNELVAMTLVIRALAAEPFDAVIVDTAPSRYALDFFTYPARLSALLEGRAVKWIATLMQRAEERRGKDRRWWSGWGKRQVEAAVSHVLGTSLVQDTTHLFAEIALIRKRFAWIAREIDNLLRGPRTAHILVAAPTGAAEDDLFFLFRRLVELESRAHAVLLNRTGLELDTWVRLFEPDVPLGQHARIQLQHLREEHFSRVQASQRIHRRLESLPRPVPVVDLPLLTYTEPAEIVQELATLLDPSLRMLTGWRSPHA